MLTICYNFCDPDYQYRMYRIDLERRIAGRPKKNEDFSHLNHEKLLKVVEEYPLQRLRSMNQEQIDALAQLLTELLRVSLFIYPNTEEYRKKLI